MNKEGFCREGTEVEEGRREQDVEEDEGEEKWERNKKGDKRGND